MKLTAKVLVTSNKEGFEAKRRRKEREKKTIEIERNIVKLSIACNQMKKLNVREWKIASEKIPKRTARKKNFKYVSVCTLRSSGERNCEIKRKIFILKYRKKLSKEKRKQESEKKIEEKKKKLRESNLFQHFSVLGKSCVSYVYILYVLCVEGANKRGFW